MAGDKHLIYEAYKKHFLTEMPVYAASSYQDPSKALTQPISKDPVLQDIGYALGTFAKAVNKDPYDVALLIAARVKKELFVPGNYNYGGKTYDLEFAGDRDDLEDKIRLVITDEFTKQGHKPHFRAAKQAARDIASKVMAVSDTRGGVRTKTPTRTTITPTSAPTVIVTTAKQVDDVFNAIFNTVIKPTPAFDLAKKYKVSATPEADQNKIEAISNEALRADVTTVYKSLASLSNQELNGTELINKINRSFNLPYTATKRILTELLVLGILTKI